MAATDTTTRRSVKPQAAVEPTVLRRELVFVTGKGGVGKTTVAAALALGASADGREAVVCELGAQTRLATTFGRTPPSAGTEIELERGLSSLSIDPDAALAEWITRNVGRAAAVVLSHSNAFDFLIAAAPGVRELVIMGKAWDLAKPAASDGKLVVVDGPSTGHAIALLQAPRTFSHLGRTGPVGRQASEIRDFLADPGRSAIVLVCTPAELPVTETLELAEAVEAVTGRPPDAVIANQVLPDRFDRREIDEIERVLGTCTDPSLHASEPAVRRAWHRAREQADELSRLQEHIAAPVVELPFLFVPALGPEELRALAVPLAAALGCMSCPIDRDDLPEAS
jgi:anion-transporting  ArsA/GET3 family ATPase